MTSANAVATVPVGDDNDKTFNTLQMVARQAAASGMYKKIGGEAQLFMILLAAKELGIPATAALHKGIWIIEGNIELSARLLNALIRGRGHQLACVQCDATACILEGKRRDTGETMRSQFTWEDAARAGLATKSNWKSYPEDMLFARALSRLARRLFPDVVGTCYVEGEIEDKPPAHREAPEAAEYVMVPATPIDMPAIAPPAPAELIDAMQAHRLHEQFLLTSETFQSNFMAYIKKRWNIDSFAELPRAAFFVCLEAIERNYPKRGGANE